LAIATGPVAGKYRRKRMKLNRRYKQTIDKLNILKERNNGKLLETK
jgi:hypothetical protein